MSKLIYFRLECTPKLGIGHFMRCISLANELVNNNKVFIVYSHDFIRKYKNFANKKIKFLKINSLLDVDRFKVNGIKKQTLDALQFIKYLKYAKKNIIVFVDCYSLDYIWEKKVKLFIVLINIF